VEFVGLLNRCQLTAQEYMELDPRAKALQAILLPQIAKGVQYRVRLCS
jgi:hypothetical protein